MGPVQATLMGTPQPQNPSVLAQALQSQNQPLPTPPPPIDMKALQPAIDIHGQMKDFEHAERNQRRKDMLAGVLTNFVFSLGQGMSASANAPRGQENAAGAGAALQGPQILQEMRLKQAQEQQRINLQQQQQKLDKARQDQIYGLMQPNIDKANAATAGQRMVPFIGADGKPKMNIVTGEPLMVPAKDATKQFVQEEGVDARKDESDKRLEILGKKTAGELRNIGIDPVSGANLGESQMPLPAQLKMQTLRLDQMLKEAQTDFTRAKTLNLPQQMADAQQRIGILQGNLAMRQKEYDANWTSTANGIPLPGAPTDQNGQPVGARVFRLGAEARKAYMPALDADERFKVMTKNAAENSPQADLSLIANHVGMTLGLQKGARVTQAYLQEAQHARPISGDLQVMWDKVTNGELLTPDQRKEMVSLAGERRVEEWTKARRIAGFSGGVAGEPAADPDLSPVSMPKEFTRRIAPAIPAPTATGANGVKLQWNGKAWVPLSK